jgi:hypothetical protein
VPPLMLLAIEMLALSNAALSLVTQMWQAIEGQGSWPVSYAKSPAMLRRSPATSSR